jgi:methyltransferase (TIGR00027 family)
MTWLGSGKSLQSIATAAIRAVETYRPEGERLYEDRVALDLLPLIWQAFIRPMRFGVVRRALLGYRDRQFPGVIGNLVCRTRFIDDVLERALADGVEQVVILGAGFDTRAYRIAGMDAVQVLEVDHPEAQATKRDRLEAVFGAVPSHVTLVPVDFDAQSLGTALDRTGFDPGVETLFVWEGVTQYITEGAVDSTLRTVAETAGGGRIVFTYVEERIVEGNGRTAVEEAILEMVEGQDNPWVTGFAPDQIGAYLADRGLDLQEDVGADEYRRRYLEPIDREMRLFDGEHAVVATIQQGPSED